MPIGGLYATYHLLGEPEATIDLSHIELIWKIHCCWVDVSSPPKRGSWYPTVNGKTGKRLNRRKIIICPQVGGRFLVKDMWSLPGGYNIWDFCDVMSMCRRNWILTVDVARLFLSGIQPKRCLQLCEGLRFSKTIAQNPHLWLSNKKISGHTCQNLL